MFTHHEVVWTGSIIKQTRSSPNWEGGMFTFATCKHQMRTWRTAEEWQDTWICGLGPRDCQNNTLLYAGKVAQVFANNYDLSRYILHEYPDIYRIKAADNNPRGDLYTPVKGLASRMEIERYKHTNFIEPKNHTRSVDKYKDGTPKWWRDIEYKSHNKRPPVFILDPVVVFSKPMIWSSLKPGRACLKITCEQLLDSLQLEPT